MTTTHLPPTDVDAYDFVIVGGGTGGCVIASRLAEYLPHRRVLLVEAGPSDYTDNRVLRLRDWLALLGGELDYDYPTTLQPMGNSHIRHSRAKVLGGCSSHNTLISFRPFESDCRRWVDQGCAGWGFDTFTRVLDNLRNTVQPVHPRHRNQLCVDWLQSCSAALDIPLVDDFNAAIRSHGDLDPCAGFFSVAYNPDNGHRSSASVAYIHPILRGDEARPNLTILTDAWVGKINVDGPHVVGVDVKLQDGSHRALRPRCETILCAGAIDTPRLMLLSGLGPRQQLADLGIPVVRDLPGVGENLVDHPETIIMWELNRPVPEDQTTQDSDAGLFLHCQPSPPSSSSSPPSTAPDLMMHCYQIPFVLHTRRLGYDVPAHAFCMTPNIPRPLSRGRLYLTSASPDVKPALDFRYFTDPAGHDAAVLVAGLRAARRVAACPPFSHWLHREVAPGPAVRSDADLSAYARAAAHTVYHPAGTMRMGDTARDARAVVDPRLRVRGLRGLRVADAAVLPDMPTVNPMLTVLGIGERAAEMVAEAWGWRGLEREKL